MTGARRHRWSALLVAAGATLAAWGCATSQEGTETACSGDAECGSGTVCRIARCRKACVAGRWVGEPVSVKTGQGKRSAVVSGCEGLPKTSPEASADGGEGDESPSVVARLWVRYESGIEEQVEASRVSPVVASQASAER